MTNCSCGSKKDRRSRNCVKCRFAKNPPYKLVNYIGKVFSNWTVLEKVGYHWKCVCNCGIEKILQISSLRNGSSKSCGCLKTGVTPDVHTKRLKSIFDGMHSRCNNKNQLVYKWYGARGIKLIWLTKRDFIEDMYESYVKHVNEHGEYQTTIERINNNGNYSKENCKWATRKEQALNRRINTQSRKESVKNQRSLKSICAQSGMSYSTVVSRIDRDGMSLEEALTTPLKKLGTNNRKPPI